MADDKQKPTVVVQESETQRASKALAEAQIESEDRQADEFPEENGTIIDKQMAYGKFIVDGRKVYADGTPVKD